MRTASVDMTKIRKTCELAMACIAPELSNRPRYVLFASELMASAGTWDGIMHPNMDLIARDVIGERWAGRGPSIVLNDFAIAHAEDSFSSLPPGIAALHAAAYAENFCLGVTLHELAHVLESFDDSLFQATEMPAESVQRCRDAIVSTDTQLTGQSDSVTKGLNHHGPKFIRSLMHVRYRAEQLGINAGFGRIHAGKEFDGLMSTETAYNKALGGEPARSIGRSFHDILASEYPEEFRQLWNRDLSAIMGGLGEVAAGAASLFLLHSQSSCESAECTRSGAVESVEGVSKHPMIRFSVPVVWQE